jgi:hypothetical protein
MKYKKIEIDNYYQATHDIESEIPFELEVPDNTLDSYIFKMQLIGIQIGELSEKNSYPLKAVAHEYLDTPGYTVDTKSVIPFGTEPIIKRKFEYFSNTLKVTTDIKVNRSTIEKSFHVDSLNIHGKWKRYAVLNLDTWDPNTEIPWNDFKADDEVIYQKSKIFHILLLENVDGLRFEVGTGFDIWRWQVAKYYVAPAIEGETPVSLSSEFKITRSGDYINIDRTILCAEKEFIIDSHNWRFHWYVSWNDCRELKHSNDKKSYKFNLTELPDCFHAKTTKKYLKSALRSQFQNIDDNTVTFEGIVPFLCDNSSHVAKHNLKDIFHWDMTDILDFWFWSNRQLMKKNSELIILPPKKSQLNGLPSYQQLSHGLDE